MAHGVLSLHARYGIGGLVTVAPDPFDGALPQGRGTQLPYKNSLDAEE